MGQRMDDVSLAALPVPPLWCPFPAELNPRWAEFDKRSVDWMNEYALYPSKEQQFRLTTMRVGELASRYAPVGRIEAVQFLSDFVIWLFAFDDAHCDESALGDQPDELARMTYELGWVLDTPQADIANGNLYATALRELRCRLSEIATPLQVERWVSSVKAYFFSVVAEASCKAQKRSPSLQEYVLLRQRTGSTETLTMLTDVIAGCELPSADRDNLDVRALAEMAIALNLWHNDILGYHKEKKRNSIDDGLNLVDVLARDQSCSAAEAQAKAIALCDRVLSLYLRLEEQVSQRAGAELQCFLAGMRRMIRGDLDFSLGCNRYLNPDDPAILPTTFADTPSDDSSVPAPIPAIQWWWTRLAPSTSSSQHDSG
ncbi:hypothetical protein GCM10018785_46430 [Streptomyces longispororuber]|uniref:Terpene synthase n=1 Tax=Streptomyces longispororuber TaxID=68230 RepID=A0A918ZWU4_9ACTN|nr:hypothetical protein [Streptomyces longispororuber]GHE72962.1 hypothetical protein GCM10018785_46430 [Streptomyces longispororuber]